jgi:transcription antitermination protein NusB
MPKWNIAARRRARRFALQALYQWQFNPATSNEIIAQFLTQPEMVSVDQTFFQELVKNIIAQNQELDQMMEPFLKKSLSTPQAIERAILRIGTYELKYCLETPYRVIVNEAIELTKAFGATSSYRYINGLLHELAKQYRSQEVEQNK